MGRQTKQANKKKKKTTAEKRRENLIYRIYVGFAIAFLLYTCFAEPWIVGKDYDRLLYFTALPLSVGMVVLAIVCRGWLKEIFTEDGNLPKDGILPKIAAVILLPLMAIVFLYPTVGFIANVIWDRINLNEAQNKPAKTFRCAIWDFHKKRSTRGSNSIYFNFKGESESFNVSKETIKKYVNEDPKDYYLEITVREGIMGNYVVDDWDVVKRD
ncbi:hypothetical protein HUK80_08635 [Flavobacterium sp. MAH-1]|uniref:Uncharacterized protein n=1 Tax=Flavobacterium agri TaxID=2743471 RepID=A0A7Y9C569_9FLAO|nr:hypothetical protein [Flavobacterium agri]NUY80957.1 hypothetical protein [Flavobacterium agri]NYA70981.1 hypothetical protein [Flavobacterium agri]